MDRERTLFQKIIIVTLVVLAAVSAIVTAVRQNQPGLAFEGALLREQEPGVYTGKVQGVLVTAVRRTENGGVTLEFYGGDRYRALCRVEYPGGTVSTEWGQELERVRVIRDEEVLFSGGYAPSDSMGMLLVRDDGSWEPPISGRTYYPADPWYGYALETNDILHLATSTELSVRGDWSTYWAVLLIAVIVALNAAFPNTLFHLQHFLHVRDPEPTDFYYAMHRLGCIVCTALLAVAFYAAAAAVVPL